MKVTDNVLDIFGSGNFEEKEVKVITSKFQTNAASAYFKEFLVSLGMVERLGFKDVERQSYGKVKYLTIDGYVIETKFCIWQALKDNDTGKANLWVGERFVEGKKGVRVGDRLIPDYFDYFGIIVVPKNFKEGMSLADCAFVDYLLIRLDDFIQLAKDTFEKTGKVDCLYITKEVRNLYRLGGTSNGSE